MDQKTMTFINVHVQNYPDEFNDDGKVPDHRQQKGNVQTSFSDKNR